MTDPIVVRQSLREGATDAVRDLVDAAGEDHGPSVDGLLPIAGVHTVTLFLDPGVPELAWYVEVDDEEVRPWTDPAETILDASPLFEAGLGEYLADRPGTRIDEPSGGTATLLVHALHPDRPGVVAWTPQRVRRPPEAEPEPVAAPAESAAAASGRTGEEPGFEGSTDGGADPHEPGANDGPEAVPAAVVLVRLGIRRGPGEWFARGFARVAGALDGTRIQRKFEEWSEPVLEDEAMWTETIYLERTGDRYAFLWYMEAESMDRVLDAYFETDNRVARVSEAVLNRILVDPGTVFEDLAERDGDLECLAHAVDPERP